MDLVGEDSLKQFAKKYSNARPALDRWLKLTKLLSGSPSRTLKPPFPLPTTSLKINTALTLEATTTGY